MGLFDKLKLGLQKTSQQLKDRLDRLDEMVGLGGTPDARTREIDVETAENLEEILLMADVGVAASGEIVEAVRKRQRRGESLRELVKEEMLRVLESSTATPPPSTKPHVILVVGVNGVGKTTTIGKLANQLRQEGRTTLICAADTFRAAAVDQLQIWADRAGVDIVRAKEGSDPAAVVFDAMTAAKARQRDVVLVDTAGRLHTRTNLMKKSGRQPLVCAADTFRAAAVEQLEIWAGRAGVDIVRAKEGSDPAAVVFDAIQSGRARGRDPILVDTAGRLHTRVNLMNELEKIR
ncbi:MAG TPA: signal recognition particle receptor subunit alpha, partial [Vicinamibacterales bacterium]|nr:signal recognition particle receptor subunit alpha [Vicinamibacterales bacterium]